jgi:hypothetical protein
MDIAIFFLAIALIAVSATAISYAYQYYRLKYVALCGCKFTENLKGELNVIAKHGTLYSMPRAYAYVSKPKQANRYNEEVTDEYLVSSLINEDKAEL